MAEGSRTRWPVYRVLTGFAAGALVTGLVLPLAADRDDAGTALGAIAPAAPGQGPLGAAVPGTPPATGEPGVPGPGALGTGVLATAGAAPGVPASGPAPAAVASGAARSRVPAAGAGQTGRSGASPAAAPAPGAASLGPSDQGVTAERIRLGFALLQVGGLDQVGQAVGVPPVEEQKDMAEAFIDEVNRAGGVGGRRLEGAYATFDPTDASTERRACLALTEDAKVFALTGTFGSAAAILCVTREHGRPFLNTNLVSRDRDFATAGGLLATLPARSGRVMANLASRVDAEGVLADKKVGILTAESTDPGAEVAGQLQGAVERRGREVAVTSRLSADLATAGSQIPIEVNRMRSAGVEHVFLLAAGVLSTQFVSQADRQRWYPSYAASDFGPMFPDSSAQNMPASFDGSILVTATRNGDKNAGIPEQPEAAACRQVYEAFSGNRLTHGTNAHGLAVAVCASVAVMAGGARRAGADLNAASYMAALQRPEPLTRSMAGFGGGAFGPGKLDMADAIRMNRWRFDCRCWLAAEPFRMP